MGPNYTITEVFCKIIVQIRVFCTSRNNDFYEQALLTLLSTKENPRISLVKMVFGKW